jgi:hypothetical protein
MARLNSALRAEIQPVTAPRPLVDLVPIVFSLQGEDPVILSDGGNGLPSLDYDFDPTLGLEDALRDALADRHDLAVGHVEQLAAHAQGGHHDRASEPRLAIDYLVVVRTEVDTTSAHWLRCYDELPWEDWRRGRPRILLDVIEPALKAWVAEGGTPDVIEDRQARVAFAFGCGQSRFDEEKVVERYALLDAAGLLDNLPRRDGVLSAEERVRLAHALARLRNRIKARPVVFDLMPERFTLYELQRAVEAVLGPHLHKQNFRRLVEHMGLVEPTEGVKTHTGGRPAKLFRFRPRVLGEHCRPGIRVRVGRL